MNKENLRITGNIIRILPVFLVPIEQKRIENAGKNKYNEVISSLNTEFKDNNLTISTMLLSLLNHIIQYNMYIKNINTYVHSVDKIIHFRGHTLDQLNTRLNYIIYCIDKCIAILNMKLYLVHIIKKEFFLPNFNLKLNFNILFKHRLNILLKRKKFKQIFKHNVMMLNRLYQKEIVNLNMLILNKKNILAKVTMSNVNVERSPLISVRASSSSINIYKETEIEVNKNNIGKNKHIQSQFMKNNLGSLFPNLKSNVLKISQTMTSIFKSSSSDINNISNSIFSNPITLTYYNKNKPNIHDYLRSMSIFNRRIEGIFMYYSKIISLNFNTNTNKLIQHICQLLTASFKSMFCYISKPVFFITADKVIIQLFYFLFIPNILKYKEGIKTHKIYYKNTYSFRVKYQQFLSLNSNLKWVLYDLAYLNIIEIYPEKFRWLCAVLNKLFKRSVELNLIRLHYPYSDSQILVNVLGLLIDKIKFRLIKRKLFSKTIVKHTSTATSSVISAKSKFINVPSYLSGLSIKIGGRLMTHKLIPKKTVKFFQKGALAKGKVNFLDVGQLTKKNKRGAFTIKVSAGHNLFF
jgi:Mitochondrial ribosomal protein (VAR1)